MPSPVRRPLLEIGSGRSRSSPGDPPPGSGGWVGSTGSDSTASGPTGSRDPVSRDPVKLRDLLVEAWREGLASGVIHYDPALAASQVIPPFHYHCLPQRASRPGAATDTPPHRDGLWKAHEPCPFDGPHFAEEREMVRLARGGREYHLICNRYPVTPLHFLVVRPEAAGAAALPQHLHSPLEIEDMILTLFDAGLPYRLYFNSNRGADGSQTGSSVNHWHYQLFRYPDGSPSPLLDRPPAAPIRRESFVTGSFEDWPARHIFVECPESGIVHAAAFLWQKIVPIHARNTAYNVEGLLLQGGRARVYLFPRNPGRPIQLPVGGALSASFRGWELSGDIVVPSREIFDWIVAHPEESNHITRERLRETTRAV